MKAAWRVGLIGLLMLASMAACTFGGWEGPNVQATATAGARATETYGAEMFHFQLTAQTQKP